MMAAGHSQCRQAGGGGGGGFVGCRSSDGGGIACLLNISSGAKATASLLQQYACRYNAECGTKRPVFVQGETLLRNKHGGTVEAAGFQVAKGGVG